MAETSITLSATVEVAMTCMPRSLPYQIRYLLCLVIFFEISGQPLCTCILTDTMAVPTYMGHTPALCMCGGKRSTRGYNM